MKRKMVFVGISYSLGLFCASFYNISVFLAFFLVGIITALIFIKKAKYAEFICSLIFFCLGLFVYIFYDISCFNPLKEFDGKSVTFTGKILEVDDVSSDRGMITARGTIDNKNVKIIIGYDGTKAEVGDYVEVYGKASIFKNSYAFNSEDYYKSQGIVLAVYNPQYMYVFDGGFSLKKVIYSYCEHIKSVIRINLPNIEGDLLCAMLFGDKSGLDNSGKTLFYRSGIGHIMATSGLHLVIIISMLTALFSKFLKSGISRAVFAALAGGVFVVCASFSASVIRAYIMLLLSYSAPVFFRKTDSLNSLCIAVIAMTSFTPYIIRSPSFVLSVFGVMTTAVFAPGLTSGIKNHNLKQLAFAVCVSLCILPVTALYFDEASIISAVSNILLIPLCAFSLCCGALVFLTNGIWIFAKPLLILGGFSCKIVNFCVHILGSADFAAIPLGLPFVKICIWLIFAGIVLYYISNVKEAKPGFALVSSVGALFLVMLAAYFQNRFAETVTVFADSSGTVSVYRNSESVIIADAGASDGAELAVNYLSSIGISEIDEIILLDDKASSYANWLCFAENFNIKKISFDENYYYTDFFSFSDSENYIISGENLRFCVSNAEFSDEEFDAVYFLNENGDAVRSDAVIYYNYCRAFSVKKYSDSLHIDYLETTGEE